MKHLTTAALIFIVCVAIFLTIRYFNNKAEKVDQATADSEISVDWANAYAQTMRDVAKWRAQAEVYKDSTTMLKVQLGQATLESNRSEAKLRQYMSAYREGKQAGNTPAIFSNCDSLVDELDHVYIENQIHREQLTDSLNAFYEQVIAAKDSQLTVCDSTNVLVLMQLRQEKLKTAIATKDRDKARKRQNIGWIAAAVGSFFAVVASIF